MQKIIFKIINSLKYSLSGLRTCFTEKSFLLEIFYSIGTVIFLFIVESSVIGIILYIYSCFVLLAFEGLNTAIEKVCDRVNKNYDKEIGAIKDISSASVFIVFSANLALFYLVSRDYI
jgi:diacylglycerol kinase